MKALRTIAISVAAAVCLSATAHAGKLDGPIMEPEVVPPSTFAAQTADATGTASAETVMSPEEVASGAVRSDQWIPPLFLLLILGMVSGAN